MSNFKYFFLLGLLLLFSFGGCSQEVVFEESLIRKHQFGEQFIWDGYGRAEIFKERQGILRIKGEPYYNNREEYVLHGTITVVDERNFMIKGNLKLFTAVCCGLLDREIVYTFCKTGNRKYWRLKERIELCDQYTCAYYLDIFV